ncbi:AAA family ATPase [Prolixibacteraceae bacterium]|nr:AAA family ATPase [Prolixibacteraceae bacterium]
MFEEQLEGVVERITYRNEENGWTVLKVKPSGSHRTISVVMYGEDIFVGKTLEFFGKWIQHKSYGRQFEAKRAVEKEPESLEALQKYLGSGLITGVGPAMARKIVQCFGKQTLEIFENDIEQLLEVPGISKSKLSKIKKTWETHSATRTMVQFLQKNDIPISYATKLMDRYGASAPKVVEENPYRLIEEVHGIGFARADAIALATGIEPQSPQRIRAMIRYILSRSKEDGNCYLLYHHVEEKLKRLDERVSTKELAEVLLSLQKEGSIKSRDIDGERAYYDNLLYEAENIVGDKIHTLIGEDYSPSISRQVISFEKLEKSEAFPLSDEQRSAIANIVTCPISILTGGPGCGKTTTLKLLVKLLQQRQLKVMLAAPTGRAAQRMGDVIGVEAKTIHRLLSYNAITNSFRFNENDPLDVDFLIIDETSMLDIQLSSHLMNAIGEDTQVLFIGDVDQLPSVGAGNVLHDMIESDKVPVFRLSSVFRQAASSAIIRYAHQLNDGKLPEIRTPFREPHLWKQQEDCMFIDSEVATQEQSDFIRRVRKYFAYQMQEENHSANPMDYDGYTWDGFEVPEKFKQSNLTSVALSDSENQGLRHILKRISPYSSIHYGLNAVDMILRLYCTTIEQYYGKGMEVQLLTPMTKGILGTENLNQCIQQEVNPSKGEHEIEMKVGKYILREGDRVIQKRNNYNLEVFNGDIGHISTIEPRKKKIGVLFKDKSGEKEVVYSADDLVDLDLAYAITIHKSQGSEFDAVIIPLAYQHFTMLTRNLVYTGMTRGKKLVVFVGNRGALRRAVSNTKQVDRLTHLSKLIQQ